MNTVASLFAGAFALVALSPTSAIAKQYEVKMLNRGAAGPMVFEPAFLQVAPGDTVVFKPTDAGHNAETVPTMLPTGASAFRGVLSQPVTVTFTKLGLYAYKCAPHYAMGMVGLIQVGTRADKVAGAAQAGKLPGMARSRMAALVAQAH